MFIFVRFLYGQNILLYDLQKNKVVFKTSFPTFRALYFIKKTAL